jgi:cyclopropane fatty-acyl-phospholipid synthase-like methyltransferase
MRKPKEDIRRMQITFEQIFKNSDMFNPVSSETLLLAGKYAELNPAKSVIDLASGKGSPSLLWASEFGVQVDGYELDETYVAYANARAKLLSLEGKARYFCQDLKGFTPDKKYDVVGALGFDVSICGGRTQALQRFRSMLKSDGVIVLTEPIWTKKPVPPTTLKALGVTQESFITLREMQQLVSQQGFEEIWHAVSTKTDWEIFVRPIFITMQEFIKNNRNREQDAQAVINVFKAEYDAACKHWNVALWVLKPT